MVAPGPDDYYWLKRRIVVTSAGAFHLRGGCQQRIVVPFKFRVTQERHLAVPNGLPEPVVSEPGVTVSSRNIVVAVEDDGHPGPRLHGVLAAPFLLRLNAFGASGLVLPDPAAQGDVHQVHLHGFSGDHGGPGERRCGAGSEFL